MIFGIGVDIVENERIAAAIQRQGKPFLDRCFRATEQAYCQSHRNPTPYYAARFAAKEAVAKALGTGFGARLSWLDVELVHTAEGAPQIVLHGTGAATAKEFGVTGVLISISHSEHYAVANAVAVVEVTEARKWPVRE